MNSSTPPRIRSHAASTAVSSPMHSVYHHHLLPVRRYVSHFTKNKSKEPTRKTNSEYEGSSSSSSSSSNCSIIVDNASIRSTRNNSAPLGERSLIDESESDMGVSSTESDANVDVDNESDVNMMMSVTLDTTLNSEEGEADNELTEDELYMKTLEDRVDDLNRDLGGIFRERDQLKKDVREGERHLDTIRNKLDSQEKERQSSEEAMVDEIKASMELIMNQYIQMNEIYLLEESDVEKSREHFDRLKTDIESLHRQIEEVMKSIHDYNQGGRYVYDVDSISAINTCSGVDGHDDDDDDDDDEDYDDGDNIYVIALLHQLDQLEGELQEESGSSQQCKSKIEHLELYAQYLNDANQDLADVLRSLGQEFIKDIDYFVPSFKGDALSSSSSSSSSSALYLDNGSDDFEVVPECNQPAMYCSNDERVDRKQWSKKHVQKPTFTSIHRSVLQTKLKEKCDKVHVKEKSIHGAASFIPGGKEHATKNLIASNSQYHRQRVMLETATSSPSPTRSLRRYYDDETIRLVYEYYDEIID